MLLTSAVRVTSGVALAVAPQVSRISQLKDNIVAKFVDNCIEEYRKYL